LQSKENQLYLKNFSNTDKKRSDCYNNLNLATRNRGGVGMYLKNNIDFDIINLPVKNIESLTIKTQILHKTCFITTVYKPPNMNSKKSINSLLQQILSMNIENNVHIIMGDFHENENNIQPIIQEFF